jgi:hypothetical protein
MSNEHIYSRKGGYGEMRCCLCGVSPWDSDPLSGCEVKLRRLKSKGIPSSNPIQLKYLIPSILSKGNTK